MELASEEAEMEFHIADDDSLEGPQEPGDKVRDEGLSNQPSQGERNGGQRSVEIPEKTTNEPENRPTTSLTRERENDEGIQDESKNPSRGEGGRRQDLPNEHPVTEPDQALGSKHEHDLGEGEGGVRAAPTEEVSLSLESSQIDDHVLVYAEEDDFSVFSTEAAEAQALASTTARGHIRDRNAKHSSSERLGNRDREDVGSSRSRKGAGETRRSPSEERKRKKENGTEVR